MATSQSRASRLLFNKLKVLLIYPDNLIHSALGHFGCETLKALKLSLLICLRIHFPSEEVKLIASLHSTNKDEI